MKTIKSVVSRESENSKGKLVFGNGKQTKVLSSICEMQDLILSLVSIQQKTVIKIIDVREITHRSELENVKLAMDNGVPINNFLPSMVKFGAAFGLLLWLKCRKDTNWINPFLDR